MSHEEALGFAQIVLALLVFALGIPALVLEATAEERIRYLLHRRVPHVPMMVLMAATLMVVGCLVWYSGHEYPVPPKPVQVQGKPVQVKGKPIPVPVPAKLTTPPRGPLWFKTSADFEMAAKFLTVTLLILYALFWLFMLKTDIRSLIVRWIAVRIRWRFRFDRPLLEADADDLIVLGESAPSEYEKKLVLAKISRVAREVFSSEKYDGTSLTPLLIGLIKIVASDYRPGTAQNYLDTVTIVGESWETLKERLYVGKRDRINLIETACRLGEAAVKSSHENAAVALLNVITESEEVLFRIGLAAVSCKRFRVAVAALNKLEVAADENNQLSKELIGLVAYFYAAGLHAGVWGQGFRRRLDAEYTADEIRAAAACAAKEFCKIAEFTTADTITSHVGALVTSSSQ